MIDQHLQIPALVLAMEVVIAVVAIVAAVVTVAVVEAVVEVAAVVAEGVIVGGSFMATLIFFVIFIIIAIIQSSSKKSIPYRPTSPSTYIPDQNNLENQIKQFIPNFNRNEFLSTGYKIYCDIQEAWMNFKLEDVKDILTDELYNMYESQLATLEVKGEQNIMKGFVLKNSYLKGVQNQNNTLTITTGYVIEFYDYIADRSTGKTIRGESKRKMRVTYEMKFRQSLDEGKKVDKCPNCGAPIKINGFGTCEYCRTKIVTENTKWALSEKRALNQDYV